MKPNKEKIEAYKEMAKQSPDTMESQIRKNLVETCQKFVGNEDKFDRCMKYLVSCARELLDGKNGDLADDVCYRICRDYFNDEVWRKEDEEEALKKAEKAKRDAEYKAKADRKKNKNEAQITASLDDVEVDDNDDDEVVVPFKPKPKTDGQLDMFAALGV